MCELVGREDGGVSGHWDQSGQWINEEGGNKAGWIGSFGPFTPIATSNFKTFFNIHSYKIENSDDTDLHPYGMKVQDGFWNVGRQDGLEGTRHGLKSYCILNIYKDCNPFIQRIWMRI